MDIVAKDEEQLRQWTEETNPTVQEAPPIAQDFTDNPFSVGSVNENMQEFSPRDLPIFNVPTPEQEDSLLKKYASKLGLSVKPVEEQLSGDKIKFVDDGSKLAAKVVSAVLGLMFTLAGQEYELLAPTEKMAYRIIRPLARIYARHSTVISEISPDYLDASDCIAAIAVYAQHISRAMREIKEMRAQGYVYQRPVGTPKDNQVEPEPESEWELSSISEQHGEPEGRYSTWEPGRTGRGYVINNPGYEAAPSQDGFGNQTAGPNDIQGFATIPGQSASNVSGDGAAKSFAPQYADDSQRLQHEALLRLTSRDIQHRLRRRG